MPISFVAALDSNHAIGREGEMPWHLPDDLRRFKSLTLGKPTLMGRKTALAIGRALPGRPNLVLTRSGSAPFAGQRPVASLEAAIACVGDTELMVIGGGEIYGLALSRATSMYLTWVEATVVDPDTFFPRFDPAQWTEVQREFHPRDARHASAFTFVDYQRAPKTATPIWDGTAVPIHNRQPPTERESRARRAIQLSRLAGADGRSDFTLT